MGEYMLASPWCDWIDTSSAGAYGVRQVEYWRQISRYAFMVSPPAVYKGEGPNGPIADTDSYRTFEALILRTIPILWRGINSKAWDGLPVVIVSNWTEITPENMRRWWRE